MTRTKRGCGAASPASFGAAKRRGVRGLAAAALVLLAGCGAEPDRNESHSIVLHGNENELIVPKPRGAEEDAVNAAAITLPAVRLAADGLALGLDDSGTRKAAFGMPRAAVTPMLAAALGNPIEEGDSLECGAGALGFANFREGLSLYFQNGEFVGWDLDGRDGDRFVTTAGASIGTTRQRLEAAGPVTIEDSTLGIEFNAGDLSGLLSSREPGGEITNLWAGVTCIAR